MAMNFGNVNSNPSFDSTSSSSHHYHHNNFNNQTLSGTTVKDDHSKHIKHQYAQPHPRQNHNSNSNSNPNPNPNPPSNQSSVVPSSGTIAPNPVPNPARTVASSNNSTGGTHNDNGNGNGNTSFVGAAPARPAAAKAQAVVVANGANPQPVTANNGKSKHIRTVTPDQNVNQRPNDPLPVLHVYENSGYNQVLRPYVLRPESARVHQLCPINACPSHPLLTICRGKARYLGIDPTSNTNFIISDL